jgi:hypothetical protein
VNVVLLRRVRHGDREIGHRDVDWSCRWIVQEHYRHLESYEGRADAHQARVSKGAGAALHCLTCGVPVTRIGPYVKGPAGMPLKAVPETVYRVSR